MLVFEAMRGIACKPFERRRTALQCQLSMRGARDDDEASMWLGPSLREFAGFTVNHTAASAAHCHDVLVWPSQRLESVEL